MFYFLTELNLDVPFYLIIAVFFAAVTLAFFLYFREKKLKEIAPAIAKLLFTLRLLFTFILAFLLLDPLLKHSTIEKEKPVVVVAIDNSKSMALSKDSVFLRENFEAERIKFQSALSEKFDVNFYRFDSKVQKTESFLFDGKESDISLIFDEIETNFTNRNLGAVVLASDGIFNKGNNPLYKTKKLQYPVYAVAFGDTTVQSDLLIHNIRHNPIAYLGNQFPVEVVVESKKLDGKECVLRIKNGDKTLTERREKINGQYTLQQFSFVFEAQSPGVQRFDVSLEIIAGEKNTLNNQASFVIEVIDARDKILLVYQSPHPDVAAIRQALEINRGYEIEVVAADEFKANFKSYNVVILHDLDFKKYPGIKNDLESASIPFLRICASNFSGLPVMNISSSIVRYNDCEPVLNNSFSLFSVSNELRTFMRQFPAVRCPLGTFVARNDVNSLLTQRVGVIETENPLLYFATNSGRKSAVFLGDGLWRWRMQDFASHENFYLFNELFVKSVQYLNLKEDKSFFRIIGQKIFNENEPLQMNAEVFNKSYELINDEDVFMTIKNSHGKTFEYVFSKNDKSYKLDGIYFPPGDYTYEARVKADGSVMKKIGVFTVKEVLSEQASLVADHQMLNQVASQTGGKLFYPKQLDELAKELNAKEDIAIISYERKKFTDLIELKWLFFVILAFVSAEWFIRKWNGLY